MKLKEFYNTPKDQRGFIWILNNIIELIRNESLNTDNYATKHDLLFNELVFLLNEGYLTCELQTYSLPPIEERKHKFKEHVQQLAGPFDHDTALESIRSTSKYFDDVFMQYALLEKLHIAGAQSINFKHKQCAMLATDIQAIVLLGNVDIEFLFEALEKGFRQIYITHYTRETTAKVFILKPTEKLPLYFEKKNKIQHEINQSFALIEPSAAATETNREIPVYQCEKLYQLDLIEFVHEDKNYRGNVVCELENESSTYEVALQIVRDVTSKLPNSKSTIMFEQSDLYIDSVLVKRPVIRNKQEEFEYYIINKTDIKTLIPYDYVGWVDQILCAFMWLNPGNTLKVESIGVDESRDIHTTNLYDPNTHTLKIAVVNLINHAMYHYFYKGIHPFDTFEKVLAHEVGHIDALVEFVVYYNEILKEVRDINMRINENLEIIKPDYTKHTDLLLETMMLIDEKIDLLQDYYSDKLIDIQQAYENALQYISPNLSYSFQMDALKAYRQNKEVYQRNLYKLYNQRYTLEKISTL